ncbi:hypothetical protein [Arthrobacter sp. ISL-65]|uniref:hypothetical protein n=1 Tax=Arthrobacter sp. ISL-65 TaxID=2819112 RepID=UPI001BEA3CDD|nr:hypothetical protein [Arthrobacter sp. ISL-65]MBT2546758.1 hypothetical protein [Arthrobacter sp. ISL-65]
MNSQLYSSAVRRSSGQFRCPSVALILAYLGATILVAIALVAWSNMLQRQLPEKLGEKLGRARQESGTR